MSTRMSTEHDSLRQDIVEIGKRLWTRGFVASNDGNISVKIGADRLLCTPASVSKGFMTAEMMVITDLDGKLVSGAPGRKPSSEIQMHLVAYRERPDVGAVVHAHPPLSTGFAVAGIPLDRAVLAEVVTTLGSIPIAEYGTPSTRELAESVAPYVKAHDGLLLANHGALALGRDLFGAYYKMETIEHFAKISLVARMLGREHLLVARRSRTPAGTARHLRHRRAGADLPRSLARRRHQRRSELPGHLRAVSTRRAARPRHQCRRRTGPCFRRYRRGDSANIRAAQRAD
jgi:L-fuculose-phosphate aldolase